jgi:hypothetical protein
VKDIPAQLGELTILCEGDACVLQGPGVPRETLPPDEDSLRRRVRLDAAGRYRPLSGARTLPGGWQVETGPTLPLERAIETVYPLALAHMRLHAEGGLRIVTLDEVLSRQTGRYEASAKLPRERRSLAIGLLCGQCVRVPEWNGESSGPAEIPCPEPCSVLVSLCREAALWEDEPPESSPADPGVAFAAFDEPGNELREAYLSALNANTSERTAFHG